MPPKRWTDRPPSASRCGVSARSYPSRGRKRLPPQPQSARRCRRRRSPERPRGRQLSSRCGVRRASVPCLADIYYLALPKRIGARVFLDPAVPLHEATWSTLAVAAHRRETMMNGRLPCSQDCRRSPLPPARHQKPPDVAAFLVRRPLFRARYTNVQCCVHAGDTWQVVWKRDHSCSIEAQSWKSRPIHPAPSSPAVGGRR